MSTDQEKFERDARQYRDQFCTAIEDAKRIIASRPAKHGGIPDGTNKALAQLVRISPSRIGHFLQPGFFIPVKESDQKDSSEPELIKPVRLKKTVSGFASSVARTLIWLKEEAKLPLHDSLTTNDVMQGFWPHGLHKEFNDHPIVRAAIFEGEQAAQYEMRQHSKLRVQLSHVKWGPFLDKFSNGHNGFFVEYGTALIKTIDPLDSILEPTPKPFSQIFDLRQIDRAEGIEIGIGPFETLARKFRQLTFVNMSLVKIPLIGLFVRPNIDNATNVHSDFSDILSQLGQSDHIQAIVIDNEVGHLTLSSLLPDDAKKKGIVIIDPGSENSPSSEIVNFCLEENNSDKTFFLVCDAFLAFETYCLLSKLDNFRLQVVTQSVPTYSFSPSLILRSEDNDFAALLREAQIKILSAPWRFNQLLTILRGQIDLWTRSLIDELDNFTGWPNDAFILEFSEPALEKLVNEAFDDQKSRKILTMESLKAINNFCQQTADRHLNQPKLFGVRHSDGELS